MIKMKKEKDIIVINRLRCINALILCTIVIVSVFIGVVSKLVAQPTAISPDEGLRTFRYFTVLSSIQMASMATLCIPFEIDGLRNHNFHLPRWIVTALYCGVCCVGLTFIVSACILAPVGGVETVLFKRSNLCMHLICPLASMLLFIFVNDDHYIPIRHSFIVLVPVMAYMIIYWLEVFFIGEANGGWRDHYYTNTYFPYVVAFIAIPLIALIMANVLRVLHNKRHQKRKKETELYYLTSPNFAGDNIEEAIAKLAARERKINCDADIVIPLRLIRILEKRYNSGLSIEELCKQYLMRTEQIKNNDK